jgi:hypothetical protein
MVEIGERVPLTDLQNAMQDWFRRKGYLDQGSELVLRSAANV